MKIAPPRGLRANRQLGYRYFSSSPKKEDVEKAIGSLEMVEGVRTSACGDLDEDGDHDWYEASLDHRVILTGVDLCTVWLGRE